MTAAAANGALAPGFRLIPGAQQPADPDLLFDHAAIRAAADAALDRRRKAYPALVEKQAMTASEAAEDIAAWQALADEWRWICTGEGEAPSSLTLFDRIEAADRALSRTASALTNAPRDEALRLQQGLYHALRWHLSLHFRGEQRSHFIARLNHQLRALAATSGQIEQQVALCGTCELRREDPATHACTRTDCGLQQKDAA